MNNLRTMKGNLAQFGLWGENPEHPKDDWKYEVANGDTIHGYWNWVMNRIEQNVGCA